MLDFKPLITEDGTLSLYNNKVNDIYHSKIGAYTETLDKFVKPSKILDYVKVHDEVKILDICYGLGYNSKIAIDEIKKVNNNCRIEITALEIDPFVIALSGFCFFDGINLDIKNIFYNLINAYPNIKNIQDALCADVKFKSLINGYLKNDECKYNKNDDTAELLHNIYYQTISSRNKNIEKLCYTSKMLEINILIGDARDSICTLSPGYDYIFHDGFAPNKQPLLWSKGFILKLFNIINTTGNLTTYTAAPAVRGGLIDAGFEIGATLPVGRKNSGTIATRSNTFPLEKLTSYERGLIDTKAGIPYYDPDLNWDIDNILQYRTKVQNQSARISSSQYIKNNKG